jgi:hypothetical protein
VHGKVLVSQVGGKKEGKKERRKEKGMKWKKTVQKDLILQKVYIAIIR